MTRRNIFITGGTGYLGRSLISELLKCGHQVCVLARRGSESKLPTGCSVITGAPLNKASFAQYIRPADTFVQLLGVSHPSPAKARQFRAIDLASVKASVSAAMEAGIEHFVYLSVAQPAPVMKAYIEVRSQGEQMIRQSGLNATILRPCYVIGSGRRWPYILLPMYWVFERIPATRDTAQHLGLVTLEQMTNTPLASIEYPCQGVRILDISQIRSIGAGKSSIR